MGHHLCLRIPDIHIQSNPKQNKIVKTSFQSQELPNGWSMSGAVLVALAIFLNGAKKVLVNLPVEDSPKSGLPGENDLADQRVQASSQQCS